MSNNCAIDRIDNKTAPIYLDYIINLTKGFNEMKLWIFKTSEDAYDFTMSDDRINIHEDLLVIPNENVVGIASVYPFAISKNIGSLHNNPIINYINLDSDNEFNEHIIKKFELQQNKKGIYYPSLSLLIHNAKVIAKWMNSIWDVTEISEIEILLVKQYQGIVHDGKCYTSQTDARLEIYKKTKMDINTIKDWINNIDVDFSKKSTGEENTFSENDRQRIFHIVNNIINNP